MRLQRRECKKEQACSHILMLFVSFVECIRATWQQRKPMRKESKNKDVIDEECKLVGQILDPDFSGANTLY